MIFEPHCNRQAASHLHLLKQDHACYSDVRIKDGSQKRIALYMKRCTRRELELLDLEASLLRLGSDLPYFTSFQYSCLISTSRWDPDSPLLARFYFLRIFFSVMIFLLSKNRLRIICQFLNHKCILFFCKLIFHLRESFILLRYFLKIFWFLFENLKFW